MRLSQTAQPRVQRITVAFMGTLVAATLAVGALAVSHSAVDHQASRKLSSVHLAKAKGGSKPVRQ